MSLLLEALKKAALEKRSRGESEAAEKTQRSEVAGDDADGSISAPAETTTTAQADIRPGGAAAAEDKHGPAVNVAKAGYLARQEAKRAPTVIEDPAVEDTVLDDAELLSTLSDADAIAAEAETTASAAGDNNVDSTVDSAVDSTVDSPAPPEADLPPDPLAELTLPESIDPATTTIDDGLVDTASPDPDEPEDDLDLDLPAEFAPEADDTEDSTAASNTPIDTSHMDEDEEEDEDDIEGLLEVASPRSRLEAQAEAIAQRELQRQAIQQLMQRTRKIDQESHRRGALMYAALTLTAVSAIGLYYYFLSLENESLLSPLPPTASLSVQPPASASSGNTTVNSIEDAAGTVETADVATTLAASTSTSTGRATVSGQQAQQTAGSVARAESNDAQAESVAQSVPVTASTSAGSPSAPVAADDGLRSPDSYAGTLEQAATSPRLLIKRRQTPKVATIKVKSAYAAYQAGDLNRAAVLYDQALLVAPDQRDALLGAASIAVQQGRYERALKLYQRRLADDGQDPYALSGLLALAGRGAADPSLQSEVKMLLGDYPKQAHLHFLLGSLQAADDDWPSAQQAFFKARANDRSNPDYAYNLAVALEHIHKPEQALAQYRDAVAMAASASASFEVATAQKRIRLLEDRLQ